MTIEKSILIYANCPYRKYRWLSIIGTIQVGFIGANLFSMPPKSLVEQTQGAFNKKKTEQSFSDNEFIQDIDTPSSSFNKLKILIQGFQFKEVFSLDTATKNIIERPYFSGFLIGCSILVFSALTYYARRSIHTITLLPNDKVRFQFFSPFALTSPPSLEIQLRNVSCISTRKSPHNYSILKLRGFMGYHLVNKVDGYFLDPKLYDKYLGYERVWAK